MTACPLLSARDMKLRLPFVVLVVAALSAAGCGVQTAVSAEAHAAQVPTTPGKAPILVNITSGKEDLHAVSMGLNLAQMAAGHGHRVVVFLNVQAPIFATKDLGADVRFADFAPVSELVGGVMAKGGKVVVCGHCAAVQKVETAQLREGVLVSDHGQLLEHLEPGMIGFSY